MKSQSEVSLNDRKGMKHEHNWRLQTKSEIFRRRPSQVEWSAAEYHFYSSL